MDEELADLIAQIAEKCELPNTWSEAFYDAMKDLEVVAAKLREARESQG